jgi:peptidoglycan/LPS O-acetylase OafA/YrhL
VSPPETGGTEYLVVIGLFTVIAFLIIGFFAWLEQRRQREYLMTIRAYLEHGQAPPPELVRGPTTRRATRIRRGLTAVALGAALVVIFAVNPGIAGSWALGLVPLAVGLARIVGAFVEDRAER